MEIPLHLKFQTLYKLLKYRVYCLIQQHLLLNKTNL